jgi:hypothetical protein
MIIDETKGKPSSPVRDFRSLRTIRFKLKGDQMTISQVKVAQLEQGQGKRIRELERSLGVRILSLQSQTPQANLSEEQIEHLQSIERELGLALLAYEWTPPMLSSAQYQRLQAVAEELGLTLIAYHGTGVD